MEKCGESLPSSPLEEACFFVRHSPDLADALGVSSAGSLTVSPLAQGEHNANFLLEDGGGRRFVLRLNYSSQMGLENQIGYEFSALEALAATGRAPLPLFLDDRCSIIPRGVLVESFVQGEWLDFSCPDQLHEAACVLADIHAVRPAARSCLLAPEDPLRTQLRSCHGLFARYCASPLARPRVVDTVERFFAKAEEAVGAVIAPSSLEARHILNTEAVPSHFLIDGAGWGSMVDWEKPIIGEVAQDIAYFLSPTTTIWDTDFVFDSSQRKRFIADYWRAVDGRFARDHFDERLRAYSMTNALVGVTWSCNALVEYADPARPLKNDKTRRKLPIYTSEAFLRLLEKVFFAE